MSNKKSGRPRDESIRRRILDAAVDMLMNRGYRETTMKDIALMAGVSKQTLYRWWNNRAELLMEAFASSAERDVLFPDTSSGKEGLEIFIRNTFRTLNGKSRVLLQTLLAESISDGDFAGVFFGRFIEKRQAFLAAKLKELDEFKGVKKMHIDAIVDMVYGAMWYRMLFGHRPLDAAFARDLCRIIASKPE